MRCSLAPSALIVTLATAACDTPMPPPVAAHLSSLDADDLAVMKGFVDYVVWSLGVDEIRNSQLTGVPVAGTAPRIFVVDTTIPVCATDAVRFGRPPGGCLNADWMRYVTRMMPPGTARLGTLAFEARNRHRLSFQGRLGADVTYISATLTDSLAAHLMQGEPPVRAIITLSAPAYFAPRSAVVAYSRYAGETAAARLERWPDGHWSVVAMTDWSPSSTEPKKRGRSEDRPLVGPAEAGRYDGPRVS
jgi:hypothetical protein